MINKLYRTNYGGELIVNSSTYSNGKWEFDKEFVYSIMSPQQFGKSALVIGNGISRSKFDLSYIKNHKNGSIAAGALKTYGCNALYRDYTPHFLVAVGKEITQEIVESRYTEQNIVYAPTVSHVAHPHKFYRIPQDPNWHAGAIAAYMACFDGHSKVYLLGFDGIDSVSHSYNLYEGTNGYAALPYGYSEEFWVQAMTEVFSTYSEVEFVRVAPNRDYRIPEAWKYVKNFRQIDFNEFATETDL